jgi:Fe-S oxidoreductase
MVGGVIRDVTLWACTTCRACVYECPVFIEHVDSIVDMPTASPQRCETLNAPATPGATPRMTARAGRVSWTSSRPYYNRGRRSSICTSSAASPPSTTATSESPAPL